MNRLTHIAALALLALGLAACKKDPPPPPPAPPAKPAAPAPAPVAVNVASATMGSAVGTDKKVTTATESFAKKDTIYVSVDTAGSGTATVKAKWTFIGKDGKPVPVKEDTQTIQATGPSTTEFHISKPDGWPVGNYQVEVLLNDQVAQTRKFAVK